MSKSRIPTWVSLVLLGVALLAVGIPGLFVYIRVTAQKVHPDFQNMDVAYGRLLKEDQTYYTANSFEVGCCQFSVYRKFLEEPAAIERRLNPPDIDLTPFQARERGEPLAPSSLNKASQAPAVQTKANLLAFD